MRTRQLLWSLPVAGAIAGGFGVDRWLAAAVDAKQDLKPAVSLPMTRVVLFNSGVGYFSRSGEIEGDARVDLAFQETDVNDLLKSLVLEDFGNGRIAAVSYDSREPISRTLSSFAIDLNDNPTFAGILSQARGERVEVTVQPGATNQPGKLTGTIVGIERKQELEVLNLWCAEGLRAVKLTEIQQLRFSNPVIESEFRRALEVLALNHDSQKKLVSLHFAGDGKRKVQVGYVIEAPIWKTSYRLILDAKGKDKPHLQGWAIVENPTDEDWVGVKMALISGRPISFKMDLYNPLYVPRPTVEPDLFASLRPPTYDGAFGRKRDEAGKNQDDAIDKIAKAIKEPGQEAEIRRLVRQYQELVKRSDFAGAEQIGLRLKQLAPDDPAINTLAYMAKMKRRVSDTEKLKADKESLFLEGLSAAEREGPLVPGLPAPDSVIMGGSGSGKVDEKRLRKLAETWDVLPAADRNRIVQDLMRDLPPKYQPMIAEYFKSLDRMHGNGKSTYGIWDEASTRSIATGSVDSAATGAALGDFFQYSIDHPVNLARQKSALLPIVGKDIEGTRVSIYNPAVQPKHPLLGLRFKNTSDLHLAQGPITVFEGSTYAGDTRVLDVQPNEERLVSYAIDLGTEVDPQTGDGTTKITSVKAVKGIVTVKRTIREVKKYRMVNRSQQDRTLIIEHPNRTNQQFKLVDTDKPIEDTKDVYRFQVALKAGEEKSFVVTEEREVESSTTLSNSTDEQMKYFLSLNEATPALKKKLAEALKLKGAWDSQTMELSQVVADLNRLNLDQDRIRKNIASTPKEAEVYGAYLKKLSDQEKEIDVLTAKQKKIMADEFAAKKKFEDYLSTLTD